MVSADAVGGAAALQDMLKTAADKAADTNMTKDDIINQTQALRAIPPHHPEATKPHDAYRSFTLHYWPCNVSQYQTTQGLVMHTYLCTVKNINVFGHCYPTDAVPLTPPRTKPHNGFFPRSPQL